jgi:hypothetical protein
MFKSEYALPDLAAMANGEAAKVASHDYRPLLQAIA